MEGSMEYHFDILIMDIELIRGLDFDLRQYLIIPFYITFDSDFRMELVEDRIDFQLKILRESGESYTGDPTSHWE